jgi:hypothetical protein
MGAQPGPNLASFLIWVRSLSETVAMVPGKRVLCFCAPLRVFRFRPHLDPTTCKTSERFPSCPVALRTCQPSSRAVASYP